MIRYGKSAQNAIAAMSCLAESYANRTRLSSGDIAKARDLPQTLVAKLLTTLSQSGLVNGSPGPRGGYALSREPANICLLDVVSVFDRVDDQTRCPFGPNWCGKGEPCPLHDKLVKLDEEFDRFLRETHLGVFARQGFKRCT